MLATQLVAINWDGLVEGSRGHGGFDAKGFADTGLAIWQILDDSVREDGVGAVSRNGVKLILELLVRAGIREEVEECKGDGDGCGVGASDAAWVSWRRGSGGL